MAERPDRAEPAELAAARRRLAAAQDALLASLVAGGPAPAGFDEDRLRAQRRALVGKRAAVLAKVAPELAEILGDGYRAAVRAYAAEVPLTGGYRQDAVTCARFLLDRHTGLSPEVRARLADWLAAGGHRARPRAGWLRRTLAGLTKKRPARPGER